MQKINFKSGRNLFNEVTSEKLNGLRDGIITNVIGGRLDTIKGQGTTLVINNKNSDEDDSFPWRVRTFKVSSTQKVAIKYGYVNSLLPDFNGSAWSDDVSQMTVTSSHNFIIVTFNYNYVSRATSSANISAVSSYTETSRSGSVFTCKIPICSLSWSGSVLTLSQMRYGNILAQIWGGSLSWWIS